MFSLSPALPVCLPASRWLGLSAFLLAAIAFTPLRVNADDSDIRFDVPALICVHEITPPISDVVITPGGMLRPLELLPPHDKIIEVVVPVTSELQIGSRDRVDAFRFNVYWNRLSFPLVDYTPKTQTVSGIEGTIATETAHENNSALGLNLNGKVDTWVTASGKAEVGQNNSTKTKYLEIPQHDILVASGTSHRGTGAFFRFHPSKTETLEGGRDLILAFRVPQSWRGGVLKVECIAEGQRPIVGAWKDTFQYSRVFVIPIYLEQDDMAQAAATEFVRTEQFLRQQWSTIQPTTSMSLFQIGRSSGSSDLPPQWVHHLIQSGDDNFLTRYRNRLPGDVAEAADRFVVARQTLMELSR